jgi:hypothetical protein
MSSTLITSTFAAAMNTGENVTQNNVTAAFGFSDNPAVAPIANGTGAGAAQHVWPDALTVNTTGTTLDLTALTNGLDGGTRNFSKVKSIKIHNVDPTNSLVIGNAAANPWTGLLGSGTATLTLPPGGHIWVHAPSAAGLAVAGGNKNLLLAAAAGTCAATLTVIGEGT